MTADIAIEFLSGLSRDEKALFLARLALELSVSARSTYVAGSDEVENPRRLRSFNELQHRVLGNEVGLLNGTPCYPDDVMVQMIFDDDDVEVQRECESAFCRAADKSVYGAIAI